MTNEKITDSDLNPTDFYPKFAEIKKAFEDAGFGMKDYVRENWDCICSQTRDYLGFTLAFRKIRNADDPTRIWQIHWADFDSALRRDQKWFDERRDEIRKLSYKDCYVTLTGQTRLKLWIPATQDNHIESMLDIVKNTKGIMGFPRY